MKAISEEALAIQLATRHCFLLENLPSDTKDNTNERTDAQKLENETLPLEHSKDSEKDTSKIESVSAIPEASKETDMVEATPSKQQPELVDYGSNLAMSEEETGKVDPEKPCSENDKKCSEDSTETEDSRSLDKLKDENDKKCLQDSIEVEHSLFDKMKHENEKKSPEDSVEIEDSNSLDNKACCGFYSLWNCCEGKTSG